MLENKPKAGLIGPCGRGTQLGTGWWLQLDLFVGLDFGPTIWLKIKWTLGPMENNKNKNRK